jgi:hydroxypyruvate isomerase
MSGTVKNPTVENAKTYEKNITYAASVLANHNIIGLIEPINNRSVPNYYMNSYERGMNSF